jgi:hypothetical protein
VITGPDDELRRLFVPVKGNNVAVRMLGLAFTLECRSATVLQRLGCAAGSPGAE